MLPQFFLTLLAAGVIGGWSAPDARPTLTYTPFRKRVLSALLILGALGTIYWAVLLRAWAADHRSADIERIRPLAGRCFPGERGIRKV